MLRIRFHGRGGQGAKTASRILGTALFLEGYEVQDAPRYGAERRGAPIFAYVRASRAPIRERGVIRAPDLVVVADDTLVHVPAAGVLAGLDAHAVLLIRSDAAAEVWKDRLSLAGRVLALRASREGTEARAAGLAGVECAGAAARLLGVIGRESLERAIREELASHDAAVVEENVAEALRAFDAMAGEAGCAREGEARAADAGASPGWVDVPFEAARVSAPAVHAAATSAAVNTGLWRTTRPVIDAERCNRCWWVCSTHCPEGAIAVVEGAPEIDYDHCKGCMICVTVCPPHAIKAVPESETGGARGEAT